MTNGTPYVASKSEELEPILIEFIELEEKISNFNNDILILTNYSYDYKEKMWKGLLTIEYDV